MVLASYRFVICSYKIVGAVALKKNVILNVSEES